MRRAVITGTGLYAPGDPIPNAVFDERYEEDVDAFLRENRNIEQRHFMAADQATSDLVVPAGDVLPHRLAGRVLHRDPVRIGPGPQGGVLRIREPQRHGHGVTIPLRYHQRYHIDTPGPTCTGMASWEPCS